MDHTDEQPDPIDVHLAAGLGSPLMVDEARERLGIEPESAADEFDEFANELVAIEAAAEQPPITDEQREELLAGIRGWCTPAYQPHADFHDWSAPAFIRYLKPRGVFDAKGYERWERINGIMECPRCGLWWPIIEEPESWVEGEGKYTGKWIATDGFPGSANCVECSIVIVEGFDGDYVLDLNAKEAK